MTSLTPARFSSRRVRTMSGSFRTGRAGLAVLSVSGRMRVPRPAARMTAFFTPASPAVGRGGPGPASRR